MMNGGGDSCNDTVADLPSDLESSLGFVSGAVKETPPPSGDLDEGALATPPDQASEPAVLQEQQVGTDDVVIADEEPAAAPELPADAKDKLPEEVSPEPAAANVGEELANGHDVVEKEKLEVADGWNNGTPDGNMSGWASADPPGEETGGVAAKVAVPSSGVLGSGPAAASPAASSPAVEPPVLQRYTYYMVRIPRPVDDDKGKADITNAELKLQAKADERNQHSVHVQAAKSKRNEAYEKRRAAWEVEQQCLKKLRTKFEELRPLRDSLKKMKEEGRSMRERNQGMPSSEEDLDYRIASLEWRIQHESIPLKEEKQLMRDIKVLQASRESVRQNAARNVQVQGSLGKREDIEQALKPLNAEYKQLEVEYKAAGLKADSAVEEYEKLNDALTGEMGQLHKVNDLRQEAYEARRLLKQHEYSRLKDFYNNKREIQQAKDTASQPKSRKAVEELCNAQLERVMELWITKEEFRRNYMRDNERSTVRRLETLDGRALGPDEKAPKLSTADFPVPEVVPEKLSKPAPTENGHQSGIGGEEAGEAAAAAAAAAKKVKPATPKVVNNGSPAETEFAVPVVKKTAEETEREAAELKEKRRAAEMAKAKEAEERKRRLAERAQFKAQAWAQKEAERKEKEREKRARKKAAAASVSSSEAANGPESVPVAAAAAASKESNDSGAEVEDVVVEQKKVSSKQRKRGVTSADKAARAAEKVLVRPVRNSPRKVLGLPVVGFVGITAVALLLVAIAIFMSYKGNSGQRAQSDDVK